jgi:hypothetical protein
MHEKDIGNPRFCIHLDTKTRIDLNISTKEKFDGTLSHRICPLVQKRGLPISF